jgi:nitroimidazol reductase NimA-like FMN-containing flavoprotein (pyridoxamine 5'-phosphate oxidase superfamily)
MRTNFIVDTAEREKILSACKTCFIAVAEDNKPYVVPMNFAVDGDTVILHSAKEGRKWEALRKNPEICVTWILGEELAWQDALVGCSYRVKSKTVIAEGNVEFVDDYDEKVRCLHVFMSQYSDRSFRFSPPSVRNVGIMRVHVKNWSVKEFGAKAIPSVKLKTR